MRCSELMNAAAGCKRGVQVLVSVIGSLHFCGIAHLDLSAAGKKTSVEKQLPSRWTYVKDVPEDVLADLLPDVFEDDSVIVQIPEKNWNQVLKIVHDYQHTSNVFENLNYSTLHNLSEDAPGKVC